MAECSLLGELTLYSNGILLGVAVSPAVLQEIFLRDVAMHIDLAVFKCILEVRTIEK